LKQFLDLHENSGADLLLCPYEEGQRLNSGFFPRMGFQLIDKEDDLACVTSWLNDDGYIERSDLYLNEHPRVEECYNGFLWLQDQIRRGGLHREVTDKLNDSDTKGLAPWDTPAASRGQHPVAPIGRLRAL
jgi:hypothetical protein